MNEKQTKTVRRIYKKFLDSKEVNRIARDLEIGGVLNWHGKAKWYECSIRKMLINEKYKGDALL
ncbi:MAG: recombinase family protein [Sporomusa sp.]